MEGGIDSVSIGGRGVDNSEEFLTVDRLYNEIVRNFERADRGDFEVQFDEERFYPEWHRMFTGEKTVGRGVVVTKFQVKN